MLRALAYGIVSRSLLFAIVALTAGICLESSRRSGAHVDLYREIRSAIGTIDRTLRASL